VLGSSLDVAIGLVFVYFLLVVIVSHVNEIITGCRQLARGGALGRNPPSFGRWGRREARARPPAHRLIGKLERRSSSAHELDYLISLELTGHPTSPRNLWPEPYVPTPGVHEKDRVENFLNKQICSGAMTLADARRLISTDWTQVHVR